VRIVLITPVTVNRTSGNLTTADRWARILRGLLHRVRILPEWTGERCDLLLALHARKSHGSIARFRRAHPGLPIVTALTGTDLYGDLPDSRRALRSLERSDRLITLQALAERSIPRRFRKKVRVIHQSVVPPRSRRPTTRRSFGICVLAHLRTIKDPLRAAMAARLLKPDSRIRIVHLGGGLSSRVEARALREMRINPRYRWIGERPRWKALRTLGASSLMVIGSREEGGANVVGEAVSLGTPVLASRVDGNVGLLGRRYAGYFPYGDTAELARLMARCEDDGAFLNRLKEQTRRLQPLFTLERERRAWRSLLAELR
jgi:putative glycosyltransferase (TIGR04348 family)